MLLPSPEIIRTTVDRIVKTLGDTQTELIKVRWKEIKKIASTISPYSFLILY